MTTIPFNNTYDKLPSSFFSETVPRPVADPSLIFFNSALATELGIEYDENDSESLIQIFSGNRIAQGSHPIALTYAGHQFAQFVPQLGDGRAVLLGEVVDNKGRRRDIQLKGSGPTAFSRRGDGRSSLGPVIREYILSEAMFHLGVPTTRALAAISSGEQVQRETSLPGGIFTRVAASHIRVGTFEYFAARNDTPALQALADYTIKRHYPSALHSNNPYVSLLEQVSDAQASLVAKWMCIGFIHGVMNTDNMAISGETIDYGPCAFMDAFHPQTVYSYIDRNGRYAYANQGPIAQWNLAQLAQALLPLIDPDEQTAEQLANDTLQKFHSAFRANWLTGMCEKLGIQKATESDFSLIESLLTLLQEEALDYTISFRKLSEVLAESTEEHCDTFSKGQLSEFYSERFLTSNWIEQWHARLQTEQRSTEDIRRQMNAHNPAFIPRNHRIEEAISSAIEHGDFTVAQRLNQVLISPFSDQEEHKEFMAKPRPEEVVQNTFCGT